MTYFQLYFAFLRIGLFTFGGGYAMLPMMERILCDKKGWVTAEEITDIFAIGQIFPGVLAVNTATFVGNRRKGVLGGVAAAFGMITPSLTIVTLIALFFDTFMEIEIVRNALSGVFVAACALIVSAVYKLFKTACLKKAKEEISPKGGLCPTGGRILTITKAKEEISPKGGLCPTGGRILTITKAKQAAVPLLLFTAAFVSIAFLGISPVLVVAMTAFVGVLTSAVKRRRKQS